MNKNTVLFIRRIDEYVEAGIEPLEQHKKSPYGQTEVMTRDTAKKALEDLIKQEGQVSLVGLFLSQCMMCFVLLAYGKRTYIGETKVFFESLSRDEALALAKVLGLEVDFEPTYNVRPSEDLKKLGVSHGYCPECKAKHFDTPSRE